MKNSHNRTKSMIINNPKANESQFKENSCTNKQIHKSPLIISQHPKSELNKTKSKEDHHIQGVAPKTTFALYKNLNLQKKTNFAKSQCESGIGVTKVNLNASTNLKYTGKLFMSPTGVTMNYVPSSIRRKINMNDTYRKDQHRSEDKEDELKKNQNQEQEHTRETRISFTRPTILKKDVNSKPKVDQLTTANICKQEHILDKADPTSTEQISECKHFSKKFLINVHETPKNNINLAYFELAKKLKQNKSHKNEEIQSLFNFSANDHQPSGSVNNFSAEQVTKIQHEDINTSNTPLDKKINESPKIISRASGAVNNVLTKTTKDTGSFGSMRISNSSFKQKTSEFDIEGPEELHFFYVNLILQNKGLAFKFENLEDETELKIDDSIEN